MARRDLVPAVVAVLAADGHGHLQFLSRQLTARDGGVGREHVVERQQLGAAAAVQTQAEVLGVPIAGCEHPEQHVCFHERRAITVGELRTREQSHGRLDAGAGPVPGLAGVVEIMAGNSHMCARLTDGTLRCWGSNTWGALGDGTTTERDSPVAVMGLTGAVEIAAGSGHTCARLTDALMRCWGWNAYGQLGDGTAGERHLPGPTIALSGLVEIAAGGNDTCARLTDGSMHCWGSNEYGKLGDGTTTERHTPVPVVW